jgi:LacI family transcriptional regulator
MGETLMSLEPRKNAKRATIKDVAHVAGVSVTTVSNVLNRRTEAMTEETLQRIQNTIQLLNYRPSRVARSLVTQQTATIGVIISEIDTPLFLQALNDIENIAREAQYNILLAITAQNLEDEPDIVDLLLEKQVDGIIYLSTSVLASENYLENLPSSLPPLVLINRTGNFAGKIDRINFDNFNGVVEAIDYLVKLGHRHIAHLLGPANRSSSAERFNGYQAGLKKHNLLYNPAYVRRVDFDEPYQTWQESTLKLLVASPQPTAIIAANDRVGAVAMRTVQNVGLRVPNDISIIGIDNQPFCNYLNPTLTTVQLLINDAGQQAIRLLLSRLATPGANVQNILLPCPLIIRESTGTAPV